MFKGEGPMARYLRGRETTERSYRTLPFPLPPPTGGIGSTLDPRSAARSSLAFTYLILCDGAYPCGASLAPSRGHGRGIGGGRGLSLPSRQSATVCAGGWPRLRPSQGKAFGQDHPTVQACSDQTRTKLEPNWIFVYLEDYYYLRAANQLLTSLP